MPQTHRISPSQTMPEHFDFIAIGGGSAGFNAARIAANYAKRIAIIDGAKELGGLCILRGCMPSKALIYTAEVLHHARHGDALGLNIPSAAADMAAVHARKRRIIGEFSAHRVEQLESGKYELIRGVARFTGRNELTVSDGRVLTADRILISTGSRISWPAVPGLRESKPWTSDDVLDLDFVPESVIVLGGGVVACELVQLLARFGSRVTQIQRSAHVLKALDPEAAAIVETAMRAEGVEILTQTKLRRVSFDAGEYTIDFESEGKEVTRRARHLVNALGREPDVSALDLGTAGIERLEDGHIRTNGFQQTTNPVVYAAGDCAGPHEIVHIAIQQAEVAVNHAFGQPVSPMSYDTLLAVVFTDPQLAMVGLTKSALEQRGTPFLVGSHAFWDHGKSILMEAKFGRIQVLADPTTGKLLGADIVGRDAGELIHVFSIALSAGLTAADMLRAPWYHPTLAEVLTYPLEEIVDKIAGTQIAVRPM